MNIIDLDGSAKEERGQKTVNEAVSQEKVALLLSNVKTERRIATDTETTCGLWLYSVQERKDHVATSGSSKTRRFSSEFSAILTRRLPSLKDGRNAVIL